MNRKLIKEIKPCFGMAEYKKKAKQKKECLLCQHKKKCDKERRCSYPDIVSHEDALKFANQKSSLKNENKCLSSPNT